MPAFIVPYFIHTKISLPNIGRILIILMSWEMKGNAFFGAVLRVFHEAGVWEGSSGAHSNVNVSC